MTTHTGNDDVQRVRDATDLVSLVGEHVALRQRGREYVGLCPFHDDSNPSFAVVVHKGKPFYKCHACGAAGDCYNFVMDYHKMEFGQALRHLAERAGIELQSRSAGRSDAGTSPRTSLLEVNTLAEQFFKETLRSDVGQLARKELASRGYDADVVDAFHIGAAPPGWDGFLHYAQQRGANEQACIQAGLLKPREQGSGAYDSFRNRLIFPIHDELDRPIAFGARRLDPDDDPKYLNSSESRVFDKSSTLFALSQAKRAIIDSGCAIVTEGYTDVITCHQHGFKNVVATLGTALTANHARVLSRLCDTVVLLFDGDAAGQKAADRAIEVFFSGRLDVRICVLPEGLDPDDLLRMPDGRERFQQGIDEAADALAYKIGRVRDELRNISTLSARQARIDTVIGDLARIGFGSVQGVRKAMIVQQIADVLRISTDEINAALAAATQRPNRRSAETTSSSSSTAAAAAPPNARIAAERALIGAVVAEPPALDRTIAAPDGSGETTVERFVASLHFSDVACQQIVDAIMAAKESGDLSTTAILQRLDQQQRAVATEFLSGGPQDERATVIEDELTMMCSTLQTMSQREAFDMEVAGLRGAEDNVSGEKISALIAQRRQQNFVGNRMPRVRANRAD